MSKLKYFWDALYKIQIAIGAVTVPTEEYIWEDPLFAVEEWVHPDVTGSTRIIVTVKGGELPGHFYEGVQHLHDKGIGVKFSLPVQEMPVDEFASQVADLCHYYELDGIDLVFDGELDCDVVQACRGALGKESLLSCSISAKTIEKSQEKIAAILPYISQIILFDFFEKKCDFEEEMRKLWGFGVPCQKISFALEVGPHTEGKEVTTVAQCKKVAQAVREHALFGLQLDSIQRDTDEREGAPAGPSKLQSGLPTGTFAGVVHKILLGN
ncbi:MAG: hypothetical protein SNF33_06335 [Candidatus Algichlamydia australiensis]|nr:hypothetical protein [Chlamydiales bacterium]